MYRYERSGTMHGALPGSIAILGHMLQEQHAHHVLVRKQASDKVAACCGVCFCYQ